MLGLAQRQVGPTRAEDPSLQEQEAPKPSKGKTPRKHRYLRFRRELRREVRYREAVANTSARDQPGRTNRTPGRHMIVEPILSRNRAGTRGPAHRNQSASQKHKKSRSGRCHGHLIPLRPEVDRRPPDTTAPENREANCPGGRQDRG